MSKKKGSKQQLANNGDQVPGPKNDPSSGHNNMLPQGPKTVPPAGPKDNQSFGPRDNQPFRPQNNQPFRPHNNQNFGSNGHQGFHPNSQPFRPRNNQSFDSKANNNNNWQKPDPAAINKLVQAHQLKATQDSQQASVGSPNLQHAEGGVNQDVTTYLPQEGSASAEGEQAQELLAETPSTTVDSSAPVAATKPPVPVAPIVASSDKVERKRQIGINNTQPDNASSAQLLYAMWEAQLTELKNTK